jgi:5-methylcytosine-specific restriction endonuclease McrA
LSWCSDACQTAYYVRSSNNAVRSLVKRRDRGVCNRCGLDVGKAADQWRGETRVLAEDYHDFLVVAGVCRAFAARWRSWCGFDGSSEVFTRVQCRKQSPRSRWGIPVKCSCPGCQLREPSWEADHVVPVCEGGGCCGLENLQTLCLVCHVEVTTELRRRRRTKE